jgi:hypothetical protein
MLSGVCFDAGGEYHTSEHLAVAVPISIESTSLPCSGAGANSSGSTVNGACWTPRRAPLPPPLATEPADCSSNDDDDNDDEEEEEER